VIAIADDEFSWEDIGKAIGQKIEKGFKGGKCKAWHKSISFETQKNAGFVGRFLFSMGVWAALSIAGVWTFPWWVSFLCIAGFSFMRF
jgi:hypothetical protein